jgi:epoxyqueuosine reductase
MLDIKQRALEIGFDLAGVAPLAAWKDLEFSRRWVERGFGGEMRYLANPKRLDPSSILPSIRSVVCVGLIYSAPLPYSEEVRSRKSEVECRGSGLEARDSGEGGRGANTETRTPNPEPRGWISRYAWGRDYHEIVRTKLETLRAEIEKSARGVETRVFVDTGPIVERAFARLSGIGWIGKNTCLINEGKGSWFFLGLILTNLALTPDLPAPDRCGSCTACLEACPTGALVEPYVMDASRCISYLNIELKDAIPDEFRILMGNNIFGCDICQDVCPWNGGSVKLEVGSQKEAGKPRRAATTTRPEFQPEEVCLELQAPDSASAVANQQFAGPSTQNPALSTFSLFNPSLETLASLSENDFRRVFAHSPIKRAKYRGWLRNLCVAIGNSDDVRFIPKLQELAAQADPLIREHAAWALARLRGVSRPICD